MILVERPMYAETDEAETQEYEDYQSWLREVRASRREEERRNEEDE